MVVYERTRNNVIVRSRRKLTYEEAQKRAERARNVCYEPRQVEVVGFDPVNATDENGNMEDYNG